MSKLFITDKEIAFISAVTKEYVQKVVGEETHYYAISLQHSKVNQVYSESSQKVWERPVKIDGLVRWDNEASTAAQGTVDSKYSLEVYYHQDELNDRKVVCREGDFIEYGEVFFEITSCTQPQLVFGQVNNKVMTKCVCVPSREGQFAAGARSSEDTTHTHPAVTNVYDPK